jgi:tetratricopeptide repeat protein
MTDTSRTIVCPRCGERLPEGYTRCDACGAYIAPGAAPASTSAGAPAKKREGAGPRRAPARAGMSPWIFLAVGLAVGFVGGYLLRAGVAPHAEGGGGDVGDASAGGGMGAGAMGGGAPAAGGQMPPEIIAQLAKYRSALAMDPNDVQANIGMGNLEFDSSHFDNAIQYYTKALDKQPDNPDVRVDRAIAYHSSGQDAKAKEEILKVTKEHPEHVNAWLNLGVVCAGMGDKATAIKAWEQYLKLEPTGQHSDAIRQELDQLKKSS